MYHRIFRFNITFRRICFFFVDIITTHHIFSQNNRLYFFYYFSLFYRHYQCHFLSITLIFDLRCVYSLLHITIFSIKLRFFCRDHSFFNCLFIYFFDILLNIFKHRIDDHFILNTIVIFASIEHTLKVNRIVFIFFITLFCSNFSSHFNQILHHFEFKIKFI